MSSLWNSLLSSFPQAAASNGNVLQDLAAEAGAATLVAALPGQGVLTLSGPDAGKFLQGQTTTDFREVNDGQSRLGCYISLKGRAISSYRAVQEGENIHLVMDAALVETVREKLAKFIVFSKATIKANAALAVLGLAGEKASALLAGLVDAVPAEANAVSHKDGLSAVRLPGEERFLLLVPATRLAAVWEDLGKTATPAGENAWRLRQIEAGVAQVLVAGSEAFQPQELNYQVLHGVSYNKGCYTGQEIVARLYFRGKLKQRVHRFRVSSSALPAPATALYAGEKHVADVVLAAQRDTGTVELLAIARPEHLEQLRLGVDGPALEALSLPYTVPGQDDAA